MIETPVGFGVQGALFGALRLGAHSRGQVDFGRGSDESARYGLELFRQLNLQLLIVTPLQKIHVIEAFVRSVHLVHNPEGRRSQVQTLTIEAYREGKAANAEQPAAEPSA